MRRICTDGFLMQVVSFVISAARQSFFVCLQQCKFQKVKCATDRCYLLATSSITFFIIFAKTKAPLFFYI